MAPGSTRLANAKQGKGKENTGEEDVDVQALIASLSDEQQTLVKILNKLTKINLRNELSSLRSELVVKDEEINSLKTEVLELKNEVASLAKKNNNLEEQFDELAQYSRRDCIVLSGPKLPSEMDNENTTEVALKAIKEELKVDINPEQISVSHRLGKPRDSEDKPRPIIVKLVKRSIKYDLVNECIKRRPGLHINESLTPLRSKIMRQVRAIRKEKPDLFKQCYTSEGRIMVMITNGSEKEKHCITNQESFQKFIDQYPPLKEAFQKINNES